MRDKLTQYVALLFAGAEDAEDVQQEILQNTLDRYDDLVAQGKSPEAAYRLAIAGIGDINEILGQPERPAPRPAREPDGDWDIPQRKLLRSIAVGLLVLSPGPLILLDELDIGDGIGVSLFLLIVAVSIALLMLSTKKGEDAPVTFKAKKQPGKELARSLAGLMWAIALAVYFLLSFGTGAWHVTWLVFPIAWALRGLILAILDLKGDNQ